jgi:hypothetical protein
VSYFISSPRRRPAAEGVARAAQLFENFHCFLPPSLVRCHCRRVMPRVLVSLGELRGLIYRSDRGQCGNPRTFIHFMERPAALACDPSGRQLYILGGSYRVTRRGIEG